MSRLGYDWLLHELALTPRPLAVRSALATRLKAVQEADGTTRNAYPPQYAPEPKVAGHVEFA